MAMVDEASAEVAGQGVDKAAIVVHRRAHVRYPGSFLPLEVDYGSSEEIRQRFEDKYASVSKMHTVHAMDFQPGIVSWS